MKCAIRVGLKPYEADLLTPHELELMICDYNARVKDDLRTGIILSFYTAAFQNCKNAGSKLTEVLAKIDGQEDMDDNALYNAIKGIHADLGGD